MPGGEASEEEGDPPSSAQVAAPRFRPKRGRAALQVNSPHVFLGVLVDEDDGVKCVWATEPIASALPHTSGLARAVLLSADREQGVRREKYKCLPDQIAQSAVSCAAQEGIKAKKLHSSHSIIPAPSTKTAWTLSE